MYPIEIKDTQYVIAVARERSFTRVAENYFISQPALSKIIKRVEKILVYRFLTEPHAH